MSGGAYARFDWPINGFYEKLYDHGVPIHQMRICQPYGMQQRKGLYQYALVEPETWERVVNRVSGANFGRLYAQTGLLAHYNTRKPSHMTWQEYAVFFTGINWTLFKEITGSLLSQNHDFD